MEPMKLKWDAVTPAAASVLRGLFAANIFGDFFLAGGTALALQFGHRQSVDIDLFTAKAFNSEQLSHKIERDFPAEQIAREENTIRCFIHGVKIDILAHEYPMLEPPTEAEGIRFAGLKDLAAMKINAVSVRGSKKDFWDIYYLLEKFSLKEMLLYYGAKYPSANTWHAEKSLKYFDDAESEPIEIIDFNGLKWDAVKKKISGMRAR